jgi:hypothetical protein
LKLYPTSQNARGFDRPGAGPRGEAGLPFVRRGAEYVGGGGQSQGPRFNAMVAAESVFEDGLGTRLELRIFRPWWDGFPSLAPGMTLRWSRRAESNNAHAPL